MTSTLSYAQSETRSNISIITEGDITRVIAPRKPWWQMMLDWRAFMAVAMGFNVWGAVDQGIRRSQLPLNAAIPTFLAAALLAHLGYSTWRRRIFEVTTDEVRVGYVRGGTPIWEDRWPRSAVGEFRVNRFEGHLLIQITGHDLKEYRISRDRQATEAAARVLQEALRRKN